MAKNVLIKNLWITKIFSLFFAFFIWLIINLTVDTVAVRDFKLQVNVNNQKNLSDNIGIKPVTNEYWANVRVSGSRSILGSMKEKDLEVITDVSKVIAAGEYDLNLTCNIFGGKEVDIVSIYPKTINVKFDKLITKKFPLKIDIDEISVPDGYIMLNPSIATELTVTGPEIELNDIDYCCVKFDSKLRLKETTTMVGQIVLQKKDGKEFKSENIICSYNKLDVIFKIYKTKEIPCTFNYINASPNLNINKLQHKQNIETIKIGCDPQKYDIINEIFLGYVDVSSLSPKHCRYEFDIKDSIGGDILNIEEIDSVSVEFNTDDMETRTLSTDNIKIINAPTQRKVKLATKKISNITIAGNSLSLKKLMKDNVVAILDLNDLDPDVKGRIVLPVKISIPNKDDVWACGQYTVSVNII